MENDLFNIKSTFSSILAPSLGVPEARPRQPRPSVGPERRLAPQGPGGGKHGGRGEFGMFVEMYFDMT